MDMTIAEIADMVRATSGLEATDEVMVMITVMDVDRPRNANVSVDVFRHSVKCHRSGTAGGAAGYIAYVHGVPVASIQTVLAVELGQPARCRCVACQRAHEATP